MKHLYSVRSGTVKLSGGDQVLRTSALNPGELDRGEEQENLIGESSGSSSTPFQESSPDDGEARHDFWSISGNHIYRRHVEPRVKLYVPREASFPIRRKCIDVTRATSTTLDVMLERRIDDYWNIEGNRDMPDYMDRLHTIHQIGRKTSRWVYWSRRRFTKKQTISRPDCLWPEIWKDMSEAAQRKEKQTEA